MLSQIDNQPVLEDIPGSASASQSQLQTHSLKFPVSYELIFITQEMESNCSYIF